MAVGAGVGPVYTPGSKVTFKAGAAITAGRLVEITAARTVQMAAANSQKVIGVALQTAGAANDMIAVQILGYIFNLTAAGAVAAGDELSVGAVAGTVSTQAAAAGATAADINKARSIIGVALDAIADTLTGWVYVGRA